MKKLKTYRDIRDKILSLENEKLRFDSIYFYLQVYKNIDGIFQKDEFFENNSSKYLDRKIFFVTFKNYGSMEIGVNRIDETINSITIPLDGVSRIKNINAPINYDTVKIFVENLYNLEISKIKMES